VRQHHLVPKEKYIHDPFSFPALQSLKEFYEDQRGRYESPNELEMRVYHRLIHIRDQRERHEEIPATITNHAVFKLTTQFRLHVQAKSAPISKKSELKVDEEAMRIFGELARVLREMGNRAMIYLMACILERLFGRGTVEDIEAIRGDLTLQDIVDGVSREEPSSSFNQVIHTPPAVPSPLKPSATEWLTDSFGPKPTVSAMFDSSPPTTIGHGPAGPATALPLSDSHGVPFNNAFNRHSMPTQSAPPQPSFTSSGQPSSVQGLFGPAAPSVFGSLESSGAPQPLFTTALQPSIFGGPNSVTTPAAPRSVPSSLLPPQPTPTTTTTASAVSFFPPNVKGETSSVPFGQQTATTNVSTSKPMSLNPRAAVFTPFLSTGVSADTNSNVNNASLTTLGMPPDIAPSQPDFVSYFIASPQATDLQQRAQMPAPRGEENDGLLPTTRPSPSRPSSTPNLSSLPKINTDVLDKRASLPSSPKDPPPLNRQRVISLPSTPNDHLVVSSPYVPALPSPAFVQSPSSGALSPLLVSTPTTSRPLKAVPSLVLESSTPPSPLPTLSRSEKKEKLTEAEVRAIALCRRGWIVRACFERWVQRTMDRAEWMEACEHSETYKQKVQLERPSNNVSPVSERKRPVETNSVPASPIRKRARKRVSSVYQRPLTDEELAARLKGVRTYLCDMRS
jgi:nuclear mRNA export protein SAC3